METRKQVLEYRVYPSSDALDAQEAELLGVARAATRDAYAPYSGFRVAAAGRLANGEVLTGTNQENASSPAGLCAERTLLSAISSRFPGMALESMAITYSRRDGSGPTPVAPCGICRQAIREYEERTGRPVRIILGGASGEVFVMDSVSQLLPLAFTGRDLA
jgi:cytidine deaminase